MDVQEIGGLWLREADGVLLIVYTEFDCRCFACKTGRFKRMTLKFSISFIFCFDRLSFTSFVDTPQVFCIFSALHL